jgi:hypothetical protein
MSNETSRREEYVYTVFMFMHASVFIYMYNMYNSMYINVHKYVCEKNLGL